MKISCIDKEIIKVLESGFYVIPRFQRPFSWESDQIIEFWQDTTAEIRKDYFIGSFVTYKQGRDKLFVVDGQQRLTTTTIILCCVRDAYKKYGNEKSAKGIHQLIEKKDLEDNNVFILQAESAFPFLQKYVQSYEKQDSQSAAGDEERKIESAYLQVNSLIEEKIHAIQGKYSSEATRKSEISKYLNLIRDKILSLKVISIELDNEDDAYTIFETMNTRGKDLTVADLAKNHFLRLLRAKNNLADFPRDCWDQLVNKLDLGSKTLSIKAFIHHYWLSRFPFTNERNLFKEIKHHINKENVRDEFKMLVDDVDSYRTIYDPDVSVKWNSGNIGIKRSLTAINQTLNISIANPMLLTLLRLFSGGKLKYKYVINALSSIEKYHYVYTSICGLPSTGGVTMMYASHARELNSEKNEQGRIKLINEFKEKLRSKLPGYDQFKAKFTNLEYSNSNPRNKLVIKYTLEKIDNFSNPASYVSGDHFSIEHICPQSSLKINSRFNIGNLILVPAQFNNEVLQNKSFPEKKNLLTNAGRTLDEVLNAATDWGNSEISNRAEFMCKLAYNNIFTI